MRQITGLFLCLIFSLGGCLGGGNLPDGIPPDGGSVPLPVAEGPPGDGTTQTSGETATEDGTGDPMNGGTETGNTTGLTIRIVGYRSSQRTSSGLEALTVQGNEVGTARIVLDHLRFQPLDNDLDETWVDGPFIVDLLKPVPMDGLEGLDIPAGLYSRIQLTFSKLDPNNPPEGIDATDPILDRSILMTGWRSDGTPFEMSTAVNEEFQLQNEASGFRIEPSDSILFIAFDLDGWFEDVALDAESVEVSTGDNGDPILFINDEHNPEIQETIEENIKISSDLFEDEDDDGLLDPDEEDVSLAAGSSSL